MTGPLHSVIGIKTAIEKFLTGMPRRFEVASGPTVFCAVLIDLDATLAKRCRSDVSGGWIDLSADLFPSAR